MADINRYYADSCDNCLNPVIPAAALSDGDDSFVCGYRCPDCRVVWTCSWRTVPNRITPPPPGASLHPHVSALLHEQVAINRAHRVTARQEPA